MLSWERIAEMARGACAHDEQSYRTPETLERYRARGCTLDLDFATEWLFVRNAYPYDTEPGITHHVLFRRRDLPMASPRGFLDGAALTGENVVWFENPPSRRSIRTVRHFHVFVRE